MEVKNKKYKNLGPATSPDRRGFSFCNSCQKNGLQRVAKISGDLAVVARLRREESSFRTMSPHRSTDRWDRDFSQFSHPPCFVTSKTAWNSRWRHRGPVNPILVRTVSPRSTTSVIQSPSRKIGIKSYKHVFAKTEKT